MEFVYRVLATAVALWVATFLPGINLLPNSGLVQAGTLVGVAVVFGLVNAVLKPLIKVAGCVLYVLTFGLIGCGLPSFPKFARRSSRRASRFSLELKSWSIKSSSIRLFLVSRYAMNISENFGSL